MCGGFILSFIIGSCLVYVANGQCTLPMEDGTWLSSTRGTWTVSSSGTSIENFQADLSKTLTTATLTCIQAGSTDTQYVLGTSFEIFFGVTIDVYTCLDIQTTDNSPSSYVYYIVTPTDSSTGEQFTSDLASVCTATDYQTEIGTHILVKSGSESNATTYCPDVILGNYSVTYTDINSNTATGILMDSCSNNMQMQFTNVGTNTYLAFSSSNLVQCLYTVTSGSNYYVHTYNNDTTVDSTNTYRFACWVFAYDGSDVKATAYPSQCQQDQSSTSVQYGGETFSFTPYVTCPRATTTVESGLEGWQIALIVLGVLLLIVLFIILISYCVYKRQQRQQPDEEKDIIKGERQPSPDSIPDDDLVLKEKLKAQKDFEKTDTARAPSMKQFRKHEDGYDSGYEEKGLIKDPFKLKDKTIREHTFELVEVKKEKGKKLKDGKPTAKSSEHIESVLTRPDGDILPQTVRKEPLVTVTEQPQPRPEQPKPGPEQPKPRPVSPKRRPVSPKPRTVSPKPRPPSPKPEPPGGKMSIPPTAPRPADDDTILIRIRKEKEQREKEIKEKKRKEEETKQKKIKEDAKQKIPDSRVEKVTKVVRESSSSGEYETDESEKEERIQKLIEKRKRLAGASYVPPEGVTDASIVGRKKRGSRRGAEDELTKTLVGREQQEKLDTEKRQRKKALRKMAKKKFRPSPEEAVSSGSDADSTTRKHKRRKAGDSHGIQAPYIEQYHAKKDIEKGLIHIDFWNENPVQSAIDMSDRDLTVDESKVKAIVVAPVADASKPDLGHRPPSKLVAPVADASKPDLGHRPPSKLELIMQEEADVWDQERGIPLPGKLGYLGPDGKLPDGFIRDKDGNIVRTSDGNIILSQEQIETQLEMRRKLCQVFGLPRLVRDMEGRPLGGYKDDEFGPTAEWDFGDANDENEMDDDQQKAEAQTAQGKQVAFSVNENRSVPSTPLKDMDYNQKKGRQPSSAECDLLKQRLFEQQRAKPDSEQEKHKNLPVYFVGKKGGVKPDSVYIDNSQVQRQDLNPNKFQRTQSLRTAPPSSSNMVMKSDTFGDGRQNMYREGLGKDRGFLQRNTRMRSSWTGRDGFDREEPGFQGTKRNIGSDDEFILVGGSFKKLNRPPDTPDSQLPVHHCSRYERHGYQPAMREQSLLSDISMRTAPDTVKRPFSGDDRRLRQLLGELYKDKKYFDYYLDTEALPTNAAVETRGLANHGRDFLLGRAEYWEDTQPVPPRPPPSELAMRLSRMQTMYTIADSGLDSRMSTATVRPHSADNAPAGLPSFRRSDSMGESSNIPSGVQLLSHRSDVPSTSGRLERLPPTGRSDLHRSPSKLEKLEEKDSQDGSTNDNNVKEAKEDTQKSDIKDKLTAREKKNDERILANNVLSINEP